MKEECNKQRKGKIDWAFTWHPKCHVSKHTDSAGHAMFHLHYFIATIHRRIFHAGTFSTSSFILVHSINRLRAAWLNWSSYQTVICLYICAAVEQHKTRHHIFRIPNMSLQIRRRVSLSCSSPLHCPNNYIDKIIALNFFVWSVLSFFYYSLFFFLYLITMFDLSKQIYLYEI